MTETLSSRFLVFVLGIPGILIAIYFGGFFFTLFITIVCILALREFYDLMKNKKAFPQYTIGLVSCVFISLYYHHYFPDVFTFVPIHSFFIILIILVMAVELFRNKDQATLNIIITLGGILYIPLLLSSLIAIRNFHSRDDVLGMQLTFSLFISVWLCDTAAYAFGKKWGRKKIMERVSPKKTVVGTAAGAITALIAYQVFIETGFFNTSSQVSSLTNVDGIVLGIVVGIFGQMGDFIESLIKRDVGVKDSSGFLKGHGGVLDRFDSLFVASPLTYLYLTHFV